MNREAWALEILPSPVRLVSSRDPRCVFRVWSRAWIGQRVWPRRGSRIRIASCEGTPNGTRSRERGTGERMSEMEARAAVENICAKTLGMEVQRIKRYRCRALQRTTEIGLEIVADAATWTGLLEILQQRAQGPGQAGNQEADHIEADRVDMDENEARRVVREFCALRMPNSWELQETHHGAHIVMDCSAGGRGEPVAGAASWVGVLKILKASGKWPGKPSADGGYSPEVIELVRAARRMGSCAMPADVESGHWVDVDRRRVALINALKPFGSVES